MTQVSQELAEILKAQGFSDYAIGTSSVEEFVANGHLKQEQVDSISKGKIEPILSILKDEPVVEKKAEEKEETKDKVQPELVEVPTEDIQVEAEAEAVSEIEEVKSEEV